MPISSPKHDLNSFAQSISYRIQMSQSEATQREHDLLRKELETVTQIKNNIILELERSLERAHIHNRKQEERLQQLEVEVRSLKEKNKDLQAFSRQRSHALTHKNIRIAQLETQIEEKVATQAEKWRGEIHALRTVIAEQEAELTQYLEDHHHYLRELQRVQEPFLYMQAERKLLQEFNQELQNQVEKAQQAGVELEEWAVEARDELQQQNEQANDLLGQVEYIVEQVSPS